MSARTDPMQDRRDDEELGVLLAVWFGRTTTGLPDRVKADVLERTAQLPQASARRRDLRAWLRPPQAPQVGWSLVATALAVVAAVGLLWFLMLPSVLIGPQPTTPAVIASPTAPSPSASVVPSEARRDIVVALDGSGDATTIAEAIELARDGDRILVRPGVHQAGFVLAKDVTIQGDGAREDVIVESSESGQLGERWETNLRYAMLLEETSAELRGLTIRWSGGKHSKLIVRGGSPSLRDLRLVAPGENQVRLLLTDRTTALVTNSDIAGRIQIEGGATPAIERSTIAGPILVMGDGTEPVLRRNTIRVLEDPRRGADAAVFALSGARPSITENVITTTLGTPSTVVRGNLAERQGASGRAGLMIERAGAKIHGNEIRSGGPAIVAEFADLDVAQNAIQADALGLALTCVSGQVERNQIVAPTAFQMPECGVAVDEGGPRPPDLTVNTTRSPNVAAAGAVAPWEFSMLGATAGPTNQHQGVPGSLPGAPVIEEVAPRVQRYLDDGAGHDLEALGSWAWLAPSRSGSVLVQTFDGLVEVGVPGVTPNVFGRYIGGQVAVDVDGTVWASGASYAALHAGEWTIYAGPRVGALPILLQPRLEGGMDLGWLHAGRIWFYEAEPGVERITRSPLAPFPAEGELVSVQLARTPDGTTWLLEQLVTPDRGHRHPRRLWVSDDTGWSRVEPHEIAGDPTLDLTEPVRMAVGPDGRLWIVFASLPESMGSDGRILLGEHGDKVLLGERTADGSWRVTMLVIADPPTPYPWPVTPAPVQHAIVATQDGLWGSFGLSGCRGFGRISGAREERYLEGVCPRSAALATDGSIWVAGTDGPDAEHVSLYRIEPDGG
jgi:hypothetical protein